ncbi:MFS transporter [Corynebacterium heidelbergense]|uniref:MFS transporter n=1 Tax=Corynebacterium heidelbergense TaxID=2055947 RepID=UPI001EE73BC9|nr:MFS transporter [Corynebacterium heidelbergense]WCZ37445.1 Proline/betaine transporter [Corynebacterium heidelbergense]
MTIVRSQEHSGTTSPPSPPVVDTAAAATVSPADRRRAIGSSFLGNLVEWFDYAVYGYLSTVIATVFFPQDTGRTALVKTLGLFAVSFLIRPIGAVVWGHIGDRRGRKSALTWSIVMMSLATFAIAFLPGYAAIGVAAPAALLLLRLVQGFSAVGEYAGASTLLTELAPPGKRGLFAAIVPASTGAGLLLGSVFATVLSSQLSAEQMASWGWRIPFALAGPLGFIGLYIRFRLRESPVFDDAGSGSAHSAPLREVFRERRALLVCFAACLLDAIGFYIVLSYLPTYLSGELGRNKTEAFAASSVALLAYVLAVLLTGRASDRIGRKLTMIASAVAFIVLTVPAFLLIGRGGFVTIIAVEVAMGAVLALNNGVIPAFLSEQFSTRVRFTGFALTFNVANAVFGGSAPMVATILIGATHQVISPAYYVVFAALITLIAVTRFGAKPVAPKGPTEREISS